MQIDVMDLYTWSRATVYFPVATGVTGGACVFSVEDFLQD